MSQRWEEFKEELKKIGPTVKQDIEESEAWADILCAIIDERHKRGLSQRDLAKLSGVPQSTVARIENLSVSPTVETLFKIMTPLGLTLKAIKNKNSCAHRKISKRIGIAQQEMNQRDISLEEFNAIPNEDFGLPEE